LQLKRDTEAADRAQKTAEERRRIREADEALARQVAEAERRRREAEAAAEAEKTRLREAEAAQRRQREEEARATAPLSNEDALKLVQAAKSLEPLRGRAGLMTLDLSSLSLGVRGSIQGTLEPLRGLVKLTELELSGCWRLSGTLEPLRGLVNLTALSLSYCRQLTGASPSIIPQRRRESSTIVLLRTCFRSEVPQGTFFISWNFPELSRSSQAS